MKNSPSFGCKILKKLKTINFKKIKNGTIKYKMVVQKTQMKKPVWLKYTESEVKEIILKIIEKDQSLTAEKIGLVLRDNYGIPSTRIYGFKIGQVLKEAGKYKSPDLENIRIKTEKLEKHINKNRQDQRTKRSLIITKAKLKTTKDHLAKQN
jgi:ribosomal protein S15P/S13E